MGAVAGELAVAHAAVYGVPGSFYAKLFSTRVRYWGATFNYRISGSSEAFWPRS